MADIGKPLKRYKVIPVSPVDIPQTPEPGRRATPTLPNPSEPSVPGRRAPAPSSPAAPQPAEPERV